MTYLMSLINKQGVYMSNLTLKDIKPDQFVSIKQPYTTYEGIVTTIQESGPNLFVGLYDTIHKATVNLYLSKMDTILDKGIPTNFEKLKATALISKIRNLSWRGGSLGSDPEIFAVDSKTGLVIPAFNFLKGKEAPDRTSENQPVFWDGFQAEFNVMAGSCLDARVVSMIRGLMKVNELAKKHNPDAVLSIQSTLDIHPDMFKDAKPEHVAFGCSPSLNVYKMSGLSIAGERVPFRSSGGHIHFGINSEYKKDIPEYVKALDKILGVACVSMFASYDNPARRSLYGLAGEYRTPDHGFEYRVLSNGWASHPTIMYMVYELARKAIAMQQHGLMKHWDATEEETIKCINECDVKLARSILKRNKTLFQDILMSMCYRNDKLMKVTYNTFMKGMEVLVEPEKIDKNWGLTVPLGYYGNTRIENMATWQPNFAKVLKMRA
jgi:hypothetical protein